MMILREIVIWICQGLLFLIGIGTAGLACSGRHLIAGAFNVDDLVPTAVIFFAMAATIGWIGDRIWPETWMPNLFL